MRFSAAYWTGNSPIGYGTRSVTNVRYSTIWLSITREAAAETRQLRARPPGGQPDEQLRDRGDRERPTHDPEHYREEQHVENAHAEIDGRRRDRLWYAAHGSPPPRLVDAIVIRDDLRHEPPRLCELRRDEQRALEHVAGSESFAAREIVLRQIGERVRGAPRGQSARGGLCRSNAAPPQRQPECALVVAAEKTGRSRAARAPRRSTRGLSGASFSALSMRARLSRPRAASARNRDGSAARGTPIAARALRRSRYRHEVRCPAIDALLREGPRPCRIVPARSASLKPGSAP